MLGEIDSFVSAEAGFFAVLKVAFFAAGASEVASVFGSFRFFQRHPNVG